MAVGKSGRIVLEIDPELKEKLHAEVKMKGLTLKEWFLINVEKDFPKLISKSKKGD
ncbi:hypothetical protein [Alteromonas sp. Mac1]|uniref:hypothetical protein n=1 Tax=Alteromonas sp. Mac1 TaxID=1777491 RepID=UPI000AB5E04A|nr:hypothetical protein [Alteromonas sp. Mac1]